MSQQFDKVVFGKKKFSDILEEIYNNQKRREAQAARDHYNQLVAAIERERQRCLIPTAATWRSCGPKYYFPEKHFKQHAEQSKAKSEQIFNASKKPDRGQTSSLNGDLNRY